MKFDIKTNIEDLEDDFKEANSIDEIKNTDDLLQLYHFSTLDDFEKIRRSFTLVSIISGLNFIMRIMIMTL